MKDAPSDGPPSLADRLYRFVVGQPRDVRDPRLFHRLALIPFLAWVGLGADGLSSSAYGPAEAFHALGTHTYLAVLLAAMTCITVLVISAAYTKLIADFPLGGGYVVATRLLGKKIGLVSGSALVVDYVLTVTVSIAAAGDAIFSMAPAEWAAAKVPCEIAVLVMLTTLNLRGVREAILPLVPVFLLFLVTHALMIGGALIVHAGDVGLTISEVRAGFAHGSATLGVPAMLMLAATAWSLGGGTYTGIEAVSNGMPLLREPRIQTARRTMAYMAISLALVASGLLVGYLVAHVQPTPGKTLNAVLCENVVHGWPFAGTLLALTLLTEGALLVVAAQAGFLGGPRVLANMAQDGWVPRRFAALSDRLTTRNGILLMGAASVLALWYTHGEVSQLVVMYSINVFVTFTLSMAGMLRYSWQTRATRRDTKSRLLLFGFGLLLCATILAVTLWEKIGHGGWMTIIVTGAFVALCLVTRRHYRRVGARLAQLEGKLGEFPGDLSDGTRDPDPTKPAAAILVGSYSAVGVHTLLNVFKMFKTHYQSVVFVSVGAIDSNALKSESEIEELRAATVVMLDRYVKLARRLGVPATQRSGISTDAVEELDAVCIAATEEFRDMTFFAGQLMFGQEKWYHGLLHNQTAYALQKRLQAKGKTLVILPFLV